MEQIDILRNLPREIADMIIELLPDDALWNCLTVSNYWRQLSNVDKYWDRHLRSYGLKPMKMTNQHNSDEKDLNKELCSSALRWNEIQTVLKNWRLENFKKFTFPEELELPRFFLHENEVAVVDELSIDKIKIYSIKKTEVVCSKIKVPFFSRFNNLPSVKEVLLNSDYLLYMYGALLFVYRKDDAYILKSIFKCTLSGEIKVFDYTPLPSFRRISCSLLHLFKDMFWISYSFNYLDEFHFLINLQTSEIIKITPPTKFPIITAKGIKNIVILETNCDVLIYNTNGNILFFKTYSQYIISSSANKNIYVILSATDVQVYDILSGKEILKIPNEYYNTHFKINPVTDVVYLLKDGPKNLIITAHDPRSRNGHKWTLNIPFIKKPSQMGSKIIYGVYLLLRFMLQSEKNNFVAFVIYLVDTRIGKIVGVVESGKNEITHIENDFCIKETFNSFELLLASR